MTSFLVKKIRKGRLTPRAPQAKKSDLQSYFNYFQGSLTKDETVTASIDSVKRLQVEINK